MMYALCVLAAIVFLGITAAAANYLRRFQNEPDADGEVAEVNPADMECCGQHEVCEKESLLAALSREVEYYNDEELDRHRGKRSDEYTAEEQDEFRDILYTMREDEVAGWVRSLQLRQVELPDELKEEVFLIVGELRTSHEQ